jgi:hypothetical protein
MRPENRVGIPSIFQQIQITPETRSIFEKNKYLDLLKQIFTVGGSVQIPFEILNSFTPQDIDFVVKEASDKDKLRFLRDLIKARAIKGDLNFVVFPKDFKDELDKIKKHFQTFPNVNYPLPTKVLASPLYDIFLQKLASEGIISSKQINEVKKTSVIKPPPEVYAPRKELVSQLLSPPHIAGIQLEKELEKAEKTFDGLLHFKLKYPEFYEDKKGITDVSLIDLGTPLLFAKMPAVRGTIEYLLGGEVLKEGAKIGLEALGYKPDTPEYNRWLEVVSTAYYIALPSFRLGAQSFGYLIRRDPYLWEHIGRAIYQPGVGSINYITYKWDKLREIGRSFGITLDKIRYPWYGESPQELTKITLEMNPQLTTIQKLRLSQILRNEYYYLTKLPDRVDYIGAVLKTPSFLGISPDQWRRSIEFLTGFPTKVVVASLDLETFLKTRTTRDFYNNYVYNTHKPPTMEAPIVIYREPTIPRPTPPEPTPPVPPTIPTPTPPKEPAVPKVVETGVSLTKIKIIPEMERQLSVIQRIKKSFDLKSISELTFKKVDSDTIYFEKNGAKNWLKISVLELAHPTEDNLLLIKQLKELKIGEQFVFEIYKPADELSKFKTLLVDNTPGIKTFLRNEVNNYGIIGYSKEDQTVAIINANFALIETNKLDLPIKGFSYRYGDEMSWTKEFKEIYINFKKVISELKGHVSEGWFDISVLPINTEGIVFKFPNGKQYFVETEKVKNAIKLLKNLKITNAKLSVYETEEKRFSYIIGETATKKFVFKAKELKEPLLEVNYIDIEGTTTKLEPNPKEKSLVFTPKEKEVGTKEEVLPAKKRRRLEVDVELVDDAIENYYKKLNTLFPYPSAVAQDFYHYIIQLRQKIIEKYGEKFLPKITKKITGYPIDHLGETVLNEIQVRVSDPFVMAHELGHFIHNFIKYTIPDLFVDLKDTIEQYRNELKVVSHIARPYDEKATTPDYWAYRRRWQELFADYFAVYMLDYNVAQQFAPNFTENFNKWIQKMNLPDIIYPNMGEQIFGNIDHNEKIGEKWAEKEMVELKKTIPLSPTLWSKLKKELQVLDSNVKQVLSFFATGVAQAELFNNAVFTDYYTKVIDAVGKGRIIQQKMEEKLIELVNLKKKIQQNKKLEKLALTIIDYIYSQKGKATIDEYFQIFPQAKVGFTEQEISLVKDFLNKLYSIPDEALSLCVDELKHKYPELADKLSKMSLEEPNYLPSRHGEGDIHVYAEIDIQGKKAVFFENFSDLEQARRRLTELLNLGYTGRIYGVDCHYAIYQNLQTKQYHVVIDYTKKGLDDKIKKLGLLDTTKYKIVDEKWARNDEMVSYFMGKVVPFDVALSIFEAVGIHLGAEARHTLEDHLLRVPKYLKHTHRVPAIYKDLDDVILALDNYITNIGSFTTKKLIQAIDKELINQIKQQPKEVVKAYEELKSGIYKYLRPSFYYLISRLAFDLSLILSVKFWLVNLFQVEQSLKYFVAKNGWYDTVKSYVYANDFLYLNKIPKEFKKYEKVIRLLYEQGRLSGEFEEMVFNELEKLTPKKAGVVGKVLRNSLEAPIRLIENRKNRPLAYMTGVFMGLDLYERKKPVIMAGKLFKIDPFTKEGIDELRRFASLVNEEINAKYTPYSSPPISKIDLANIMFIFLRLPFQYSIIDLATLRNSLEKILFTKYDWSWEKDKKTVNIMIQALSRILLTLSFLALTFYFGGNRFFWMLYKKSKKKTGYDIRKSLMDEVPLFSEHQWMIDTVLYGFPNPFVPIDLSSSLSYLDTFMYLVESPSNLIAFRMAKNLLNLARGVSEENYSLVKRNMPTWASKISWALDLKTKLNIWDIPMSKLELYATALGLKPIRISELLETKSELQKIQQQQNRLSSEYNQMLEDIYLRMFEILFNYPKLFVKKKADLTKEEIEAYNDLAHLEVQLLHILEKMNKEGIKRTPEDVYAMVKRRWDLTGELRRKFREIVGFYQMTTEEKKKYIQQEKNVQQLLDQFFAQWRTKLNAMYNENSDYIPNKARFENDFEE